MASRVITVALVGEGTAARRPSAQCNAAHTSMLRWRMRSRAIRTSRGRTYALPCARLLQPAVARAASYGPFCMASTRPTYVDTECTHHAAAACVVVTEIDAPPSSPSPSPSLLVLLVLATSSPLPSVRRAGRESDARSHVRSEGPAEHCVARHRHIVRYGTGATPSARESALSLLGPDGTNVRRRASLYHHDNRSRLSSLPERRPGRVYRVRCAAVRESNPHQSSIHTDPAVL